MQEFFTWPPANYDDPVERRWLGPYAIVLLVLSTCCTAGRLYLRSRRGHLPWDDWLIFVAWVRMKCFLVQHKIEHGVLLAGSFSLTFVILLADIRACVHGVGLHGAIPLPPWKAFVGYSCQDLAPGLFVRCFWGPWVSSKGDAKKQSRTEER